MDTEIWKETFVEQKVNYMLEMDGKFILIENVPARVCLETGERLFSPETVERLQQMVWKQKEPSRRIEVPVFEFAAYLKQARARVGRNSVLAYCAV